MASDSSEPPIPEPPGAPGRFSSSSGVVVAVAAACFLLLGACVLCGGGLALPVLLRRQAAVNAERTAIEAQRAADEQIRYTDEAMRKEQEAMRKLPEQGVIQDEDAVRPVSDGGEDSTERVDPE